MSLRTDPAKLRAWQRRSKKLKPGKGPQRKTWMRIRSASKTQAIADRRDAKVVNGPRDAVPRDDHALRTWITRLPCAITLRRGYDGNPVDPAHVGCVQRWGDWLADRACNIMPLSRTMHNIQHSQGIISFQGEYRINMAAVAELVGCMYLDGWTADGVTLAVREAGDYMQIDIRSERFKDLEIDA